jgi:hypothetical protein
MTKENEMPDVIWVGTRFEKRVWAPTDPFKELIDSREYVAKDIHDDVLRGLRAVKLQTEFFTQDGIKEEMWNTWICRSCHFT